jgi:hypothetical protein
MDYYLDLFTPETWEAFKAHGAKVSGFRERQRKTADRIKPGDKFVCYLVRLSRWCGILEVTSKVFIDNDPIFTDPDPFIIRFEVRPIVVLDVEKSIPILDEAVWSKLSMTKNIERGRQSWAQIANVRASLRLIGNEDGQYLTRLLNDQNSKQKTFPLSSLDKQRMGQTAQTTTGAVLVTVPSEDTDDELLDRDSRSETRDSIKIQATLARIGAEMGFRIWVPRSDKQRVLNEIARDWHENFLEKLPLNYDETTLRTVEQIDVIWLKGRSMARAFEVEHSTAIYSGLLRMADLLALQPNMDIRLHIVAPEEKREKVLREITRPVFSLLDRGPLYHSCSYIGYDAIESISRMPHLSHMSDSILEEYEELAEDQ